MDSTDPHPLLFLLFLGIYLLNALGNLSMVAAVRSDGALRSPMYYFLGHLSLVDVSFTTVTVPRLLASLLHPGQPVPFGECFAQMYFFLALGITESYLLAAMSYDRAVAVCQPLHYPAAIASSASLVASGTVRSASLVPDLWPGSHGWLLVLPAQPPHPRYAAISRSRHLALPTPSTVCKFNSHLCRVNLHTLLIGWWA
ncbi:Olfactory receptor 1L1 [Myotis davidii]|uniref:Olfactory receptor 1L1 n=1 Tax=Myotis davidii TaxID=225400 RepID=L5LC08_MYODS|nr:Olfactory receptor 1L1 [Myotis davidii]